MHFHSPPARSSSNNAIYIDFIPFFKFEKKAQQLILSNPSPGSLHPAPPIVPMPAYICAPGFRRRYKPSSQGEEQAPIQPTPSEEAEVTPTSNPTPPADSPTDEQPPQ